MCENTNVYENKYVVDMSRKELINCINYSYNRIDHLEGVILKLLSGKRSKFTYKGNVL